jgi:hypothetical protein
MKKLTMMFMLGGADLEMAEIRKLLDAEGVQYVDKGLTWGAKASAYQTEIEALLAQGTKPVLIELEEDLPKEMIAQCMIVDHHGKRAGADKPTSLHQVFALLELPAVRWTRRMELVAANDRGYIPALQEVGATMEEIRQIRVGESGAPAEMVEATRAAIAEREIDGRLTVVRLPHTRSGLLCDMMHPALGGVGYDRLLVITSDGQKLTEVNFYGDGTAIETLDKRFPGGWKGGSLPKYGYWGKIGEVPSERQLVSTLTALE